jgi:FkbM family methyltransferase
MASNSPARRVAKRILYLLASERLYRYCQSVVMAWDIRTGGVSEPEVSLLSLAVHEGDTVLDIGANCGLYTYHLSQAVGHHGRVYAFEPIPSTNNTLRLVAKLLRLRNVHIIPKGCSDRTETTAFVVPKQDGGPIAAALAHMAGRKDDAEGKEARAGHGADQHVWCEVVALDEFLPPIRELSFIKCDIEGAELFAFRGGQMTISHHHPTILCEINRDFLRGFNIRLEELTRFFFRRGYDLYKYDGSARQLTRVDTLKDVIDDNYLFIHGHRRQRFASLLSRHQSGGGLTSSEVLRDPPPHVLQRPAIHHLHAG